MSRVTADDVDVPADDHASAGGAVDWSAAVRSGRRLAPLGPRVSRADARDVVAELRRSARQAEQRVRETTGLGIDVPVAEAEVVDRGGWIEAAAAGMAELTAPLTKALVPEDYRGPAIGSQLGLLLAYLSSRVLGQYDPVGAVDPVGGNRVDGQVDAQAGAQAGAQGRLLLVAPNIVMVERELQVNPTDFRLWICLHESTHRVQFSSVPWMVDYFRGLVEDFADVAPRDASDMLRRVLDAVQGRRQGTKSAAPFIRRIQSPEQQVVFDRLTALMTVLEGHADVVMDAVGPEIVPSVAQIRAAFDRRRNKRRGVLERLVRSAMGMDAKMAQYAKGAAFVRAVTERVGMAGFNAVFDRPEALPTMAEIAAPEQWVARVHG